MPLLPSPVPEPPGVAPYRLSLDEILGKEATEAVRRDGELRFHCVGDTGGRGNPIPQRAVVAAMAFECAAARPPRFFYHLGDVVYPHGERTNYDAQFFQPYAGYPAPIVGVPGNHDAEAPAAGDADVLRPFVEQFCAPGAVREESRPRAAAPQPNVYWTLQHEWITIVGAYTGVPDGGHLGPEQEAWLESELREAPAGIPLLLAMHHPVFSVDTVHGSNLALRDTLDACFSRAGRIPDAVFSAHAHCYQRFARIREGRTVPYIVAGSGGFHDLHRVGFGIPDLPAAFAGVPNVTLESHQTRAYGFLTVTARPEGAEVTYNAVVRRRPVAFDAFRVVSA